MRDAIFIPRFAQGKPVVRGRSLEAQRIQIYQSLVHVTLQHAGWPVGASVDVEVDYEDFHEDANLLSHLVDHVPLQRIWVGTDHPTRLLPLGGQSGVPVNPIVLGGLPSRGGGIWDLLPKSVIDAERAANAYARLASFQAAAGRRVALCGMSDETQLPIEVDLAQVLWAWRQEGVEHAFLKVATQPKYGVFQLSPIPRDLRQIQRKLIDVMGLTIAHLGDRPGTVLAQALVEMYDEYRFFVVGGIPRAGAGCIEEYTPFDNEAVFDPKVRRRRQARTAVHSNPALVEKYLAFARRVSAEMVEEDPRLADGFVLDVYHDHMDRLGVVEINGLRNSGQYALDYAPVLQSMLAIGPVSNVPPPPKRINAVEL